MKKIKVWYFEIINSAGKREIVAYGDETKYTQDFATEAVKKNCSDRGWTFVGIYND